MKPGVKARPMADRFWEKVNKNGPLPPKRPESGPCWLWMASDHGHGYGQFVTSSVKKPMVVGSAHIVAYNLLVGQVPEGKELDHLCRVRRCVNPDHLEPVTRLVNVARGDGAKKSHCHRGHPLTDPNLYYTRNGKVRMCRTCRIAHVRAAQQKKPKLGNANAAVTHCPYGHPYDEENTAFQNKPNGKVSRYCKACNRRRANEHRRKA
jgi:hypothetical protein